MYIGTIKARRLVYSGREMTPYPPKCNASSMNAPKTSTAMQKKNYFIKNIIINF